MAGRREIIRARPGEGDDATATDSLDDPPEAMSGSGPQRPAAIDFHAEMEAQLRDKAYRIASMHPSEEGYDPARSAKARELLDSLAKAPVDTGQRPVNTKFGGGERVTVDQVNDDAENPGGQLATVMGKRGQTWDIPGNGLHEGQSIEDPGEISLQPNQDPKSPGARFHIPNWVERVTQPIKAAGNVATLGGLNAINDLVGTDSPDARAREDAAHPYIQGGAKLAGALIPGTPAARLMQKGGQALNTGIGALAKNPRVAAILGIGGSAANAALAGGTQGAIEGIPQGPRAMLEGASEGAASAAPVGAGFGVAGLAASGGASLLRDPNIKLLERYGMKPGMLKPVVREESNPLSLGPSPTGFETAGPESRMATGLNAAEAIVPDIKARHQASRKEIGALRIQNDETGLSRQPQALQPMLDIVQAMKARPGAAESRPRLDKVQAELEKFASGGTPKPAPGPVQRPVPQDPNSNEARVAAMKSALQDLSPGSPAAKTLEAEIAKLEPNAAVPHGSVAGSAPYRPFSLREGLRQRSAFQASAGPKVTALDDSGSGQSRPPLAGSRTIPAGDVQDIATMASDLGHPDVMNGPKHKPLFALGQKLKQNLPPEMLAQDKAYAKAATSNERSQRLLRIGKLPLSEPGNSGVPRSTVERAAETIAAAPEQTKFGAKMSRRVEALRKNGPPRTMRNPETGAPARGTPDQIDYGTLLDQPAIQSAQESLQLNPSALFSGGWAAGAKKLIGTPARRFIYPVAKHAGEADFTPEALGIGDIVGAVKKRRQKQDQEGDEK